MRNLFSSIVIGISLLAVPAAAQQARAQPWYIAHPNQVTTLRQALAEDRAFMNAVNPQGYQWGENHRADDQTCAVFSDVGLSCGYNARTTLTTFLAVNGRNLFPPSGRTNPYCSDLADTDERGRPVDCFIGHGRQNAMLREAVRRNAALFRDGDLTAADVRTRWH